MTLTGRPLQRYLIVSIYRHRAQATARADERLRLTHEVVGALAAIKLQAWQAPLAERVRAIRAIEVHHLRRVKFLNAIDVSAANAAPLCSVLVAYATFSFATDRAASPANGPSLC